MTPSEGYRLYDRHVSPMLSAPVRDLVAEDASQWLSRRLRDDFEARAAAQGRPLFLHKFTGWPRSGLLTATFPRRDSSTSSATAERSPARRSRCRGGVVHRARWLELRSSAGPIATRSGRSPTGPSRFWPAWSGGC